MAHQLDYLFHPRSIAVVGASDRPGTVGYAVIRNLADDSFKGAVYPINPGHTQVHERPAFSTVSALPEPVDLAIIATRATLVPDIVEDCGRAGVKGIVIISAGFREAGEAGQAMSEQILSTARKYSMRVVGPNCLGFINPSLGLNPSFASGMPKKGNIAFISQSGALCTAILDWSVEQSVGFSHFISIGSMLDIGFHDLIDYLGKDPYTKSILIYMESIKNPRRFLSAARAFSRNKPIIVLKAGKSKEGARASLSHTGTLAGNDEAFRAAFRRAGIIQVDTIQQLFNCAQALAMQPLPKGNRLAIVTNAGGPGVLATDYLVENGGQIATLSADTLTKLDELLPTHWSHSNPVDVLGDADAESFSQAVRQCAADPEVDAVLAILTSQAVTAPADVARALVKERILKPVLACWMGEGDVQEAREILEGGQIPNFRYPEGAVRVFLQMYGYSRNLQLLYETPPDIPESIRIDKVRAQAILSSVRAEGRFELTETEAKSLLASYDIDVVEGKTVSSIEEARDYAKSLGFPVAMKMSVPGLHHKSELRGVRLGVSTAKGVRKVYRNLLELVQAHFPDTPQVGVRIEKMMRKRYELHVGARQDPIFGPVIVFGTGGVLLEVFSDVEIGLPPLNMALAQRVIENTKIYRALKGYRGELPVDLEALKFMLVKFAYLVMDFPEIEEIDVNPYAVDHYGGVALDAHVVLNAKPSTDPKRPYRHLAISPYPTHYKKEITLRDGQTAQLRPIRPEDEHMLAAMFDYVSEQSIYFRFLGYIPKMNHDSLIRFTQNDYDREIAIVATVAEEGENKMAGVVRLISDPWNETAEYAILIADPFQGQGLGGTLTDFILEIAVERGTKRIEAEVMTNNKAMLGLLRKRGFQTVHRDIESVQLELNLVK